MAIDKISIRNVKNISILDVGFKFPDSRVIVITGKNGVGKTTIIKSFNLIVDPNVFAKLSGENALKDDSKVSFSISGIRPFTFFYNKKLGAFDSKDILPRKNEIISELPIPHGARFKQFSKIAGVDSELKINIASTDYKKASKLIDFLTQVYASNKFSGLKSTTINKDTFYFTLRDDDYYIREDHFSSGEYFLIQLYRLITSGAKLILIDELDVALDAVAQVNLFSAIKPILQSNNSRLIVISHSLAFMETVDDGGLYYLEDNTGVVTLEPRSFGYIKSDLFGFKGFDRYIITEDEVLEGFIEFIIMENSVHCYYQHITIGVAGVNQLQMIVEKNDSAQIFSDSVNVLCIVDRDVYSLLTEAYEGPTKIICSIVDDIEMYVYLNRETLLPEIDPPRDESSNAKRASKRYWKWLTITKGISKNYLYKLITESKPENTALLLSEVKAFLEKKET
jgi:ABC-type multidrug transport system ATPase subunit